MTRTRSFPFALVAGLLSLLAIALWLSSGSAGHAATNSLGQGITVQVPGKEISWATNGACNSEVAGAVDFGTSPPGGGELFHPQQGTFTLACVLSNATWNVDAASTNLIGVNNPNSEISSTNLALTSGPFASDSSPAPISQECDLALQLYCDLSNSHSIVLGASPSPETSGFVFGYRLTVPSATPEDTYTGSVTFTASN